MGTRADFYVGRGKDAEWLGSIAWDGYPEGIPEMIREAPLEETYRTAVKSFLEDRKDATMPEQGWPWPWEDSRTTDCAYAFDEGKVWLALDTQWAEVADEMLEDEIPDYSGPPIEFPNMKDRQAVTFAPRSGILVLSV